MDARFHRTRSHLGRLAALVCASAVLAIGCGSNVSNSTSAEGRKLAAKVMHAPASFYADTTPGANGQITPALFSTFGGVKSSSNAGFVAGFKGNYVNATSTEGISITIIEFRSAAAAAAYFGATANQALAYTVPRYSAYLNIPGAVQIDGTKPYAGDYDHGVVMTRGKYYSLFVYATIAPASIPVEFPYWVKTQYSDLT